jgi:GNAT superfamily N-acetyltransferase
MGVNAATLPFARTYEPPVRIAPEHILAAFTSGNHTMDEWLKTHALGNEGKASRTYVVTDTSKTVVAYYSLAMGGIKATELPRRLRHDNPTEVPVTILGRLAVDSEHGGKGLGSFLLKEAMLRTLQAAHHVGVRALLVHAVDEAAERFYEKFAFVRLPGSTKTLILPIETLEKTVRR